MSPALDSFTAPHASEIRRYCPFNDVVMFPFTHVGTTPPDVVNVPPPTFANGCGQPACSIPSGGRWSLLSGYTPPITRRTAYTFLSWNASSSPFVASTSASHVPCCP